MVVKAEKPEPRFVVTGVTGPEQFTRQVGTQSLPRATTLGNATGTAASAGTAPASRRIVRLPSSIAHPPPSESPPGVRHRA